MSMCANTSYGSCCLDSADSFIARIVSCVILLLNTNLEVSVLGAVIVITEDVSLDRSHPGKLLNLDLQVS